MRRRASKSGFTLLEVLVASILMAMLITILTMVFNSSSIAWSTGRAIVAEMNVLRRGMSVATMEADNAVPGVEMGGKGKLNTWGYLVGPWDAQGKLRSRAIERTTMDGGVLENVPRLGSGKGTWLYGNNQAMWATFSPAKVKNPPKEKAYVVGVWSFGPDGKENSGDDISTWPDAD